MPPMPCCGSIALRARICGTGPAWALRLTATMRLPSDRPRSISQATARLRWVVCPMSQMSHSARSIFLAHSSCQSSS